MDNLHAEKFAIGQNEPNFNYDGSGISPEEREDDVRYEGDPADVYTFEGDGTEKISVDDLKRTVVPLPNKETEEEGEEIEDGTNYTNILLIGGLLLALLFYKKK